MFFEFKSSLSNLKVNISWDCPVRIALWGGESSGESPKDAPLGQAGQDAFGPYFDVQLSGAPGAEQPYLGLLLHRGEEKKITLEVQCNVILCTLME